jgi:hypothetical protein
VLKRSIMAAVATTVLVGATALGHTTANKQAEPQDRLAAATSSASSTGTSGLCAIRWYNNGSYDTWAIKRIIRCAVHHFPVPGGASRALYVAHRESRFDPYARNGTNKGIYQQGKKFWPDRYRKFGFDYLKYNIYNARTNVIVSIRMVHRHGWGAWAT